VKSVYVVKDDAAQAAVLHALNRDYFRATGERSAFEVTVTVHHREDETARVEQIVYKGDPTAQRR
jgi:hypothetical protein